MTYVVTVLPGDGIGPEVVSAAQKVLSATGVPFEWEECPLGEEALKKFGRDIPQETIDSLARTKLALKGPTNTPVGEGHSSINVFLRKEAGLFCNLRTIRSMPGVKSHYSDVAIDLVIFRENLEDLYVGEERVTKDGAESIARFTRKGCEQFARYCFQWAKQNGRKKVTVIHKANILKQTHGLFLKAARVVSKDFPEIECNDLIADNFCMQVVMHPDWFDCILAPNFLGDLVSDLCAGLVGGLGFAPGANLREGFAIFEAVHGTAPDIAGQQKANPSALILSGAMMLDYLGEKQAACRVRSAIDRVLIDGRNVTRDVNRERFVGTREFTDAVIAKL